MEKLEKQSKINKLEKLKLNNLSNVRGGGNGITDGTNLNVFTVPTTTQCSGGCSASTNPNTGETTYTGGTWTAD